MFRGVSAQPGRLIGGRYELEAPIGKGGVGEVWRARHVALNSRVAIKLLQLASAEEHAARRRFTTEAQITAQLKTPNAVQVFDFGVTDEGQPYLVMELLDGETLGARLARSTRLGAGETARILGQAVKALHRAHQIGIVHRDFKPDNVIICVDHEGRDQVKVLDFGIAKLVGALGSGDAVERPAPAGDTALASFTRTGTVLGTPLYMAPEQVRDSTGVDLRADIWALGVVAFECLTGRPPFTGATVAELFERIQGGLHASASFLAPDVPGDFDAWFDKACAVDPDKRFTNVAFAFKQLATALDAKASGSERVLVLRASESANAAAPTLEAPAPSPPRREAARADARPLVRARHLADWLKKAAGDEDPWRARFLAAIPAETRRMIDAAPGIAGWLPIDLHVQLADLMQDAYGPARAHEHYRGSFADSLRGGLIGPLVRTGLRLFGASPATFLRWADRGWEASFRNCGALSGEILGPGRGRLVYSELPAVCIASDAWLGSAQGSAYGALDVLEVSGVVRIDRSRRKEGRMELVLEWTERRQS